MGWQVEQHSYRLYFYSQHKGAGLKRERRTRSLEARLSSRTSSQHGLQGNLELVKVVSDSLQTVQSASKGDALPRRDDTNGRRVSHQSSRTDINPAHSFPWTPERCQAPKSSHHCHHRCRLTRDLSRTRPARPAQDPPLRSRAHLLPHHCRTKGYLVRHWPGATAERSARAAASRRVVRL